MNILMRTKGIRVPFFTILLLGFLSVYACGGGGGGSTGTSTSTPNPPANPTVFTATDYYPLNVNDWIELKNEATGTVHRSSVTGTKNINGVTVKIASTGDGNIRYRTSDASGVKYYGYTSTSLAGDIIFSSPLLIAPGTGQIGTSQKSSAVATISYNGTTYHVDTTITTTILALEDITTEQSTLKDCLKLSNEATITIRETGETETETSYSWFYKGVGLVRQVTGTKSETITASYIGGILAAYTTPPSGDPLDNWRQWKPLPQDKVLYGVTYGNGVFVAVGLNGTIFTSDGVAWTPRTSGTTQHLSSVTYGNGVFVAVGHEGTGAGIESTILTSPDGVSWTSRTSGTTNSLYGVTYGNGVFVAVGWNGTILTSQDGISWTSRTSGTTNLFYGVTHGNGVFVAVSYSGTIFTSIDGITWALRAISPTRPLRSIACGNGIFVAVGDMDTIFTSPDGNSWTFRFAGTGNALSAVSSGNGVFVVVGGSGTILTSDGVAWTPRTSGTTQQLTSVTYGNGVFVAVGLGIILQSGGTSP